MADSPENTATAHLQATRTGLSPDAGSAPAQAGSPALAELQELARLRAEADHLERQLRRARVDAEAAEERSLAASVTLAKEKEDVVALESMSLTRVLASMRGRRIDDLEREQAEVRAAEYTYAVEQERWQASVRDVARLTSRLNAIGALEGRHEQALAAREHELGAESPEGARLATLALEVGAHQEQLREITEAQEAAGAARAALEAAAEKLSSAGSWATYDTFLGGGVMGDMVKHQRIDEAAALIRRADAALKHLSTEVADVGQGGVGELGITEMSRAFDVWFDNIFSDWSVAQKIKQAQERVVEALGETKRIGVALGQQERGVRRALAALEDERVRTLEAGI